MNRFVFAERHGWAVGLTVILALFSTVSRPTNLKAKGVSEHARALADYSSRLDTLKTGDESIDKLAPELKNIELTKKGKLQVVRFQSNSSRLERQKLVTQVGATWMRDLPATESAIVYADKSIASKLEKNKIVKSVWTNSVAELFEHEQPGCAGGSDEKLCESFHQIPYAETQWNIERINADKLWKIETGCSVRVCVVDTGLDISHPDIGIRHQSGRNFVPMPATTDPTLVENDLTDFHGHGTHVSGIIAGSGHNGGIIGVAPNAQIIAAKVFGTSGYSDYATITEAVAYCNSVGADVINMSLGGGSVYPPLVEEIQHAIKQGTVVVLAAGNSGRGEEHDPKDPIDNVAFPGSIPEVLTVSASDALNRFAEFSSEGPRIDIMAPGTFSFTWISTGYWPTYEDKGIYSSIAGGATVGSSYDGDDDKIDGKRRFGRMSGTSMAAPHVAGAAALLKGLNNSASSEQVSDALIESAQRISGQPTNRQGAGLLDVQAAYELLKN